MIKIQSDDTLLTKHELLMGLAKWVEVFKPSDEEYLALVSATASALGEHVDYVRGYLEHNSGKSLNLRGESCSTEKCDAVQGQCKVCQEEYEKHHAADQQKPKEDPTIFAMRWNGKDGRYDYFLCNPPIGHDDLVKDAVQPTKLVMLTQRISPSDMAETLQRESVP